jgi:hypothetical protein
MIWLMAADLGIARDHDLVYAIHKNAPDFLVFMPRKKAIELTMIWDALDSAKTWGEFRRKMPPEEYDEYMERSFDEDEKPRPKDEEAFSPTDRGWEDGEWPENPMYWMDTYIPPSVMALGTPITTVFGGSWIYATLETEALKILHEEGYKVEQDYDLVKAACGQWWGVG